MRIQLLRTSVLCVALLSLSGCGAFSSKRSAEAPKPIACDAQALERCELALIEPTGATLRETEKIDVRNRERWARCVHRHDAALACFCSLAKHGVLSAPPADCGK